MSNKIVLTGGGTAGHVMLHLALLDKLKEQGWDPIYIGSRGIEKSLIEKTGIPFKTIMAGKLRRYLSIENFIDVFKVFYGTVQSFFILLMLRPRLVFTKGGFVSVPVATAAWMLRIPVITHESDVTPGLANKIIGRFSQKLLYSFPETQKYLPKSKSIFVGTVIRDDLLSGSKERGLEIAGLDAQNARETLLIMGGSQGAQKINQAIEENYEKLIKNFRIIHLTGKGKKLSIENSQDYVGFEFVSEELKHLFAVSDYVVSRAGANSIFELLALNKPMLLIPLEQGSRGDQVLNANSFASQSWATVLRESELDANTFMQALSELKRKSPSMKKAQALSSIDFSGNEVLRLFADYLKS